jgi:hypothetical protein
MGIHTHKHRKCWGIRKKKGNVIKMRALAIREGSHCSRSKTLGGAWEGNTRHACWHVETAQIVHRDNGACWSRNALETLRVPSMNGPERNS